MRRKVTATGASRTSGPIVLTIGPNVYEHWLDEIGASFDTSGMLVLYPPDDVTPLEWLHSRAAETHATVLDNIAYEAQRRARGYERDQYYVGDAARAAEAAEVVRVLAQEKSVSRRRAARQWVRR